MDSSELPHNLADWLDLLESRHPVAIDLGLERCGEVWRRMGSPRPAPIVFTVAGTNGKGSTAVSIGALLASLGYSQGAYTSPHLFRFNERVCVNGSPVEDQQLLQAFRRVEAVRGGVSLTYFEFTTLAAFSILEQSGVDCAVLEVGLGGRLDAVNLIDADCSVITPIGLDHQEFLGADRESIGREKAGIIRPGRPVVCGDPSPPGSVVAAAAERGAPITRLGVDFTMERCGETCRFRMGSAELEVPAPVLPGRHQVDNLATALAAVLSRFPEAADRPDALGAGVRAVVLPGRMQRLSNRPALWVDVGHNPRASRAIAETLASLMQRDHIPHCRAVLAMLADKDVRGVVRELGDVIATWYLAGIAGARGQSGEALARAAGPPPGTAGWKVFDTVPDALDAALEDAGDDGGVLVFGSFVTASDALRHWMLIESTHRAGKRTS